jgi:broad specificity phosphatase PhoE
MTTIILVRHGQTEWNREERFRGQFDIPLNKTGEEQAQVTAERIHRNYQPAAVYSSPLSRAAKTAGIIAETLGLAAVSHQDLLDIDYGEMRGLNGEEAHNAFPEVMRLWLTLPGQAHFPNGESLDAVRARAESFLEFARTKHEDQTIVAVGHTVINRVMLLAALGLENDRMWDLGQGNCALNLLEHTKGRWRVVSLNDTGHLQ